MTLSSILLTLGILAVGAMALAAFRRAARGPVTPDELAEAARFDTEFDQSVSRRAQILARMGDE